MTSFGRLLRTAVLAFLFGTAPLYAGFTDGPAVYAFCGGDPVNRTDPMGTKWRNRSGTWVWVNEGDGATPNPPNPPSYGPRQALIGGPLAGPMATGVATGVIAEKTVEAGLGTYAVAAGPMATHLTGAAYPAWQGRSNEGLWEEMRPKLTFKVDVRVWRDAMARPYEFYRFENGYKDSDTGCVLCGTEIFRRSLLQQAQREPAKRVYPEQTFSRIDYSRLLDDELRNLANLGDDEAKNELSVRGVEQARDRAVARFTLQFINSQPTIDMTGAPGSRQNAAGFPRNGPWFWRQMLKERPEIFSNDNRALIGIDRAPRVDSTWVTFFPEYEYFIGDTLVHHHVDQGPIATPLPQTIHRELSGTLHPDK